MAEDDETDKKALSGDTPEISTPFQSVRIPSGDWEMIPNQNCEGPLCSQAAGRNHQKSHINENEAGRRHKTESDSDCQLQSHGPLAKKKKKQKSHKNQNIRDGNPDEELENMLASKETALQGQVNVTENTVLDVTEPEFEPDIDVGPRVSDQWAQIVGIMAKRKMDEERVKKKFEKHKRPENCGTLVTLGLNPEIEGVLDHPIKSFRVS